jgi:sulfatase maturation enzyme AslB (radical SAM superfamily)
MEYGDGDVLFDMRLQTNRILRMTYDFAVICQEEFGVGFSLDGPEDLHDCNRCFSNSYRGIFAATMRAIELYMLHAAHPAHSDHCRGNQG